MNLIGSDGSVRDIDFRVYNDVVEDGRNVFWNCSNGINSIYLANISGLSYLFDFIRVNYTSPGSKVFTCNVTSLDGNSTKSLAFTVDGLKIENYDILMTNISRMVSSFSAASYFESTVANISINGAGRAMNISKNESVLVFFESNYSSDGNKVANISLFSTNYADNFTDSFELGGVGINDYRRILAGSTGV
jgi:hypothetical protein